MKDLVFLFFLLSFIPGIIAFALCWFLYQRHNVKALGYYCWILGAFTVLIVLQTVLAYFAPDIRNLQVHRHILLTAFSLTCEAVVIALLPRFAGAVLGDAVPRALALAGTGAALGFCASVGLDMTLRPTWLVDCRDLIVWTAVAATIIFIVRGRSCIRDPQVRSAVMTVVVANALFIPWQVAYIALPWLLPRFSQSLPHVPVVLILHYLIWNVLNLRLAWLYFRTPFISVSQGLPSWFIQKNGLTGREQELLGQVIQGQPNRSVAANLFISEKTVRNHISNIYRKIEVKNRLELLQLLRRGE